MAVIMALVEEEGGRGTTPGFTRVSTQDTDRAVAATSFPRVVEAGVRDTVASATSTRALAGAGAGVHRAAMKEGSAEAEVVGAGQTLAAPRYQPSSSQVLGGSHMPQQPAGPPPLPNSIQGAGVGRCTGGCSPTDTSNGVIAAGDLDYFEQVSTGSS